MTETLLKSENNVLEKLHKKGFHIIDKGWVKYIIDSPGDKSSRVTYDVTDRFCFIDDELVGEISSEFNISPKTSKRIIEKFITEKFDLKVRGSQSMFKCFTDSRFTII